ncbi:hypothetical protein CVD28_26105 [Bacillus sp. M6-12]|uniref:DUF3231 family protein n=1 Tax=Bacillus sp. M6-12 TaxID=2054166 RepID=UPI000C76C8C4|nr:DUF3231 family protein [Bacillus sp. M6-12]PLS14778.1 hypothetical protein CVD28_26105 [Bacillus sp. M6-12]
MGILSGNPKEEPLHAGEVFHLWTHLHGTKGMLVTLEIFANHTGDNDLKILLEDLKDNCIKQEEQQVEAILKECGIRLPPAPPNRPNVEVQDIPAGARFNDPEIAALVSKDIAAGMVVCSTIMGLSIREDIAQMFGEFHSQKSEYAAKLLTINKEKGWLVPPPLMARN